MHGDSAEEQQGKEERGKSDPCYTAVVMFSSIEAHRFDLSDIDQRFAIQDQVERLGMRRTTRRYRSAQCAMVTRSDLEADRLVYYRVSITPQADCKHDADRRLPN